MNTTPFVVWPRPKCLFAALAALLLFAAVSPASVRAQDGPPPALVRVAEAQREQVRQRRLIVGHVEPGRRSIVAAEEPGRVNTAPPDVGSAVAEGDLLATIDTTLIELDLRTAESRISEAEAAAEEAQADLQLATRERERLENLVQQNSARRKELEDAVDRETASRARLHAAEASLQRNRHEYSRLRQRLEKARVVAPFDGYVVQKETEVGQWLTAGQSVAELVEISTVKIRLEVPESMIGHIPRNEPLPLRIEALAEERQAELFSVVPDADPRARTFAVMLNLPNEDGRIKPGMSVRAHLPTGDAMQAITVPRDAVQTTPAGTVVYVNRNGVAGAVPVRVRFGIDGRFVLEDGSSLEPGDQVIVQGNERLAPGQPLTIVDDPPTPGTAERDEDAVDL